MRTSILILLTATSSAFAQCAANFGFTPEQRVDPDTLITWTTSSCAAVALQAYQDSSTPLANYANPRSGQYRVRDVAAGKTGRIEIKLWCGGSAPCSSVFVNLEVDRSCSARFLFTEDLAVNLDSPIRWDPESCAAVSLQAYVDDKLRAERTPARSGEFTMGGLLGPNMTYEAGILPVALTLWCGGPRPCATVRVRLRTPCLNAKLNLQPQQVVTATTLAAWTPATCAAEDLQIYQDGKLELKAGRLFSGRRRLSELVPNLEGPVVISLFMGQTTPAHSLPVAFALRSPLNVTLDFETETPLNITYETGDTVIPGCFVEGSRQSRRTDKFGAAKGAFAFRMEPNAGRRPGVGIHENASLRVARTKLTGIYRLGVWSRLPAPSPDQDQQCQAGPEFALGLTEWAGEGWRTTEAGIQYQKGCIWAVWTYKDGKPAWVKLFEMCLPQGTFHHLSIEFDLDTGFYRSFTINGTGRTDISRHPIPAFKDKFKEWAAVISLEAEPFPTCGSNEVATCIVDYDLVSLTPVTQAGSLPVQLTLLSAANQTPGLHLAPGAAASIFGARLSTGTSTAGGGVTDLLGTRVETIDSKGQVRMAQLSLVSPERINFQIPQETAEGKLSVAVKQASGAIAGTFAAIGANSPGIFTMSSQPAGIVLGSVRFEKLDGSSMTVPTYVCQSNGCTPVRIGIPGDAAAAVLTLHTTGIAQAARNGKLGVSVGNASAEVLETMALPDYPGVWRVDVRLDLSLRGRGETPVVLRTPDEVSNVAGVIIE